MENFSTKIISKNSFMRSVFLQMVVGLLITIAVSIYATTNYRMQNFVIKSIYVIMGAEFILVFMLGRMINKISSSTAKIMFIVYSVMNGLTLSIIYVAYDARLILNVLLTTTVIFIVMAIYGYTTKEDLSGYGKYLIGGVWAVVIVSLINIFMGNPMIDLIISIFAVVIFTALIAFDVNRLISIYESNGLTEEDYKKISTMGALSLYLDFINLFLHLLRIFGGRGRRD